MSTYQVPKYDTRYFKQIFETPEIFVSECKKSGLMSYTTVDGVKKQYMTDENLTVLYHLIYGRHGNDPIRNASEIQFKYKMYSIIFQYGPTWQKRLELQNIARSMTLEEAATGTSSIYNHAFNDSSEVGADNALDGELRFVNDQNVSKYKKGKTDTIMQLWDILKVDITDSFLNKFDKLFKTVGDTDPYIFRTYEED